MVMRVRRVVSNSFIMSLTTLYSMSRCSILGLNYSKILVLF